MRTQNGVVSAGPLTRCEIRNTKCETRYTKYERREVETKGIEPSFPRCDRGVLPLHHVPESALFYSITPKKRNLFSPLIAGIAAGKPWRTKNLKPPALVADDFFHRLSLRLFCLVRWIPDRHKLNNRNILRNAHYRPDLVRIERANPAGRQSQLRRL